MFAMKWAETRVTAHQPNELVSKMSHATHRVSIDHMTQSDFVTFNLFMLIT
jgi:hypothetical protein